MATDMSEAVDKQNDQIDRLQEQVINFTQHTVSNLIIRPFVFLGSTCGFPYQCCQQKN